MASLRSPSENFIDECKKLVKSITHFEENDENFGTCVNYSVSKLLYPSQADVNCHAVKRKITRLYEKFYIQSDLEKAEKFNDVTEKLIKLFTTEGGIKINEGFSILHILLCLCETSKNVVKVDDHCSRISDSGSVDKFDWTSYLREDDITYSYFSDSNSEISLSELGTANESHSSDDDSLENLPDPVLRPPPRDDSGLGISPDSCSGISQHFHVQSTCQQSVSVIPIRERNASTFYPYWQIKYQKTYGSCPYDLKTINFTQMWNELVSSKNLFSLIEKKVIVHERNLIKEILWMLLGVKQLFIAQWDGRKFITNSQIHLCNLTSGTVTAVLNEFCEYATRKATLHDFLSGVLMEFSNHTLTYQAYAQSMMQQLEKLDGLISKFDKNIRQCSSIVTLLVLKKETKPLLQEIDTLYNLHNEVSAELSGVVKPFEKACKLLNALWKSLHHRSLQEKMSPCLKTILIIFLKTCKPYFTFLEEQIILCSFKDPHEEFIIERKNIDPMDGTFWDNSYRLQSVPRDIEQEFFLNPFLPDMLSAGKSLEILNAINSVSKTEPFRLEAEKGDMYFKFIEVLQKLICRKVPQKEGIKSKKIAENSEKSSFLPSLSVDPLLEEPVFFFKSSTAKFFQPDINPAYKPVSMKVSESIFPENFQNIELILEDLEPRSLRPLTTSITRALNTCMKFAYYPVCRRLLTSLREDHQIMRHLSVMRKYFLMDAGDLMFSFYSEIFEKIFNKEPWLDVSFLHSALQNAIFEDKEHSGKLCIFVDQENSEILFHHPLSRLNALQFSYEVNWPVSIMLGPSVQTEYCHIFNFLLQIKCAKYLLDELYKRSLSKENLRPVMKVFLRSKLPREQKIHGMHIIRMRLLFFVNGLHNFIMTRILHSFGLEFTRVLENSKTVDEMIVAHNKYLKSLHERCLLDRRILYLKEQILQVLNLCHLLQTLWVKGVDQISFEDLQSIEEKFSSYSNFLLCCFNTPLRRGTYLHLESLVSTMLSSTHSFHVFGK